MSEKISLDSSAGIQSNKWGRWLENYNKGTTGYCIKRCNDARYKWK